LAILSFKNGGGELRNVNIAATFAGEKKDQEAKNDF